VSRLLAAQRRYPLLQVLALVLLFIWGASTIDGFSTETSIDSMLVLAALLGLAALGQTLVLVLGGIDFSVPGHIVMGAIVVSELYGSHHWSPVLAILAVVAIIGAVVLHRTIAGRHLYLFGANPRAAGLARIRTGRVVVGVFMVSAIASGLVGVLLAGFAGADQTLGDPYLFTGLTAVIVGGTTFMGARGDYTHTVIGALILTVLTTILVGKGYDQADQQIIFGILILLVVASYGRERRLRDRV
jgi:ribose transport system permease protein